MSDIWVFGYGSLMWRPGFEFVEARPALVYGYRRALCVYSEDYRGTPEVPGLVLGLDRGGSCWGRAFRIAARHVEPVLRYLDDRELGRGEYQRRLVGLRLGTARLRAFAYVVNRRNHIYAGALSRARQIELIVQGHGNTGRCLDYVANTVAHLAEMGIADAALAHLLADAREASQR